MVDIINALGLATLLTTGFALRFRYWRSPAVLAGYFSAFLVVEWIAGRYFIPPGALGLEMGLASFALTIPLIGVILFFDSREQSESETEAGSDSAPR